MQPEGSLPCSQEPSTGPYPEPDRSSTYHPSFSSKIILILSTYLSLSLPSSVFPSGFLSNVLYTFLYSYIRDTCSAHYILLDLIILIDVNKQMDI
jgi:hypothetical protein